MIVLNLLRPQIQNMAIQMLKKFESYWNVIYDILAIVRGGKTGQPDPFWPAKNGSGRAGPPPINGLDPVSS